MLLNTLPSLRKERDSVKIDVHACNPINGSPIHRLKKCGWNTKKKHIKIRTVKSIYAL